MKKSLLLFSFVFVLSMAWAQERVISGKVTSVEDGSPLPGVNVVLKGTTNGTVTDTDGNFKLNTPASGGVLVISFIGLQTQEVEIGNRAVIDVPLSTDVKQLTEVVVTALGVTREKRSLGNSAQEVTIGKLNVARDPNIANALAGKVAGVQVFGQSGAKFGTPSIRIRGVNSLSLSEPLYVVDGTPTDVNFVNMDNVETLTVLKGPGASALYGNRASAGVIVITTKRGKKQDGVGLEVNHSTTFDQVSLLPKYQNEYGGGYSQDFGQFSYNPAIDPASWAAFDGQNIIDYSADESWGPKMDGTLYRPWYSWIPTDKDFGKQVPFSPNPNNVKDFFNTGVSVNNNIAFSKGGDNYSARISYTNLISTGIIPNSKQKRDYLSTNLSLNLTSKLTAKLNLNYSNENTQNRPADGYGGQNQTIGSFNQWFQRQLDLTQLKEYRNPDGTYRSWNITGPRNTTPLYWDNPYTQVYAQLTLEKREKLFGDIGLNYKLTDWLNVSATARRDFGNFYSDRRVSSGTKAQAYYGVSQDTRREDNYEFLLAFNKKFGDFGIVANAGGNLRKNRRDYLFEATNGGLAVPDFYNIAASKDRPTTQSLIYESSVRSFYGSVSLDYKDIIYVDATARNDWSSTLPKGSNSYFYPSLSTSFVFSELIADNSVFSFGKIRGSVAQVGSDTDPYQINPVFSVGTPYGSNPTETLPTRLPNQGLKPGISTAYEGGLDVKFFNNRVGFELTAYTQDNKNQILSLSVPSSSGYSGALINAGNIRSKGVELHINATPVKTANFSWELDFNADRSRSQVIELAEGLDAYDLRVNVTNSVYASPSSANYSGVPIFGGSGLSVIARKGSDYGTIVGKKIRTYQATDGNGNNIDDPNNGKRMVDADGFYLYDQNKDITTILPKFKGGLLQTFTYKNFTLRVNLDYVVGGKFYSTTKMFNNGSGLGAETVGNNEKGIPKRDPVSEGGGTLLADAVKEDGTPNDIYVDTQTLYESALFDLNEYYIYSKTYVKLREVNLSYNFPRALLAKTPFRTATFALIVRNPFLVYSKVGGGIDPSETSSLWGEGGQLPPVRSMGFNIKFSL